MATLVSGLQVPTTTHVQPKKASFFAPLTIPLALPLAALAVDDNYEYGAVDAPAWVLPAGAVLIIATALLPLALQAGDDAQKVRPSSSCLTLRRTWLNEIRTSGVRKVNLPSTSDLLVLLPSLRWRLYLTTRSSRRFSSTSRIFSRWWDEGYLVSPGLRGLRGRIQSEDKRHPRRLLFNFVNALVKK